LLRDHEKDAVFSLLVRQVEAQEARTLANKVIAEEQAKIAAANATISGISSALKIFGFDMSAEKPWDAVREAVGSARYNEAIRIAKNEPPPPSSDEGQSDDGIDDFDDTVPTPSNIREMVIEQLAGAGADGLKAGALKEHIAGRNVEMHDKTVGMTLYRLSKDGIVRREGRTWFFVPEEQRNQASDSRPEQAA